MSETVQLDLDYTEWRMADARLQRILNKEYPDGLIYDLPKSLYTRILRRAKRHDMDMPEYLQIIGFSYNPKAKWDKYRVFPNKAALLEAFRQRYKDGIVGHVHKTKLYPHVLHFAHMENKTVREFLEDNGFDYNDRYNMGALWEEDTLVEELERAFPDRVVDKSVKLWFSRALQNAALRRGETPESYMRHLGFQFSVDESPEEKTRQFLLMINKAYPTGVVYDISQQSWYEPLRWHCRYRLHVTVPQFLDEWGFNYINHAKHTLDTTEQELEQELVRWVNENGMVGNLERWPMFPGIKKYARKKLMTHKSYVLDVLKRSEVSLQKEGAPAK